MYARVLHRPVFVMSECSTVFIRLTLFCLAYLFELKGIRTSLQMLKLLLLIESRLEGSMN